MAENVLEAQHVSKVFGGLVAVNDVDFNVPRGGIVSLIGPQFFFDPLREAVSRYVFPPLAGSYRLEPAALGEEVVLHGAIAMAAGLQ